MTIDLTTLPSESPLIDQSLKTQLSGIFDKLEAPVTVKAVADLSREKDMELAVFLKSLTALSSNLPWSSTRRRRLLRRLSWIPGGSRLPASIKTADTKELHSTAFREERR